MFIHQVLIWDNNGNSSYRPKCSSMNTKMYNVGGGGGGGGGGGITGQMPNVEYHDWPSLGSYSYS